MDGAGSEKKTAVAESVNDPQAVQSRTSTECYPAPTIEQNFVGEPGGDGSKGAVEFQCEDQSDKPPDLEDPAALKEPTYVEKSCCIVNFTHCFFLCFCCQPISACILRCCMPFAACFIKCKSCLLR